MAKRLSYVVIVSTHAPARGATPNQLAIVSLSNRFNPRTRTGCDGIGRTTVYAWRVSTHAPARGATTASVRTKKITKVSTHAPARGATHRIDCRISFPTCFNPRTSTGCDWSAGVLLCGAEAVSTHAPARGATPNQLAIVSLSNRFNPRTRTGCDGIGRTTVYAWRVSTHAPARGATTASVRTKKITKVSTHAPARGATHRIDCRISFPTCFNPRTSTGCDWSAGVLLCGAEAVSTHAPARGATLGFDSVWDCISSFNPRTRTGCDMSDVPRVSCQAHVSTHAPARGATWRDRPPGRGLPVSTHAPARGATMVGYPYFSITFLFQPTHPHGVRLSIAFDISKLLGVSTHAPARGATNIPPC